MRVCSTTIILHTQQVNQSNIGKTLLCYFHSMRAPRANQPPAAVTVTVVVVKKKRNSEIVTCVYVVCAF